MMASTVCKFVDAISTAPTTRLDLNPAGGPWRTLGRTAFPPPPMRRQVTSNYMVDGDAIPASAWGNREVRLALQLRAATPTLAATQMQLLNRELARERNVLMWQPDDTTPAVFFRCFRSPDYEPDLDFGTGTHTFNLTVRAEPFAYGTREQASPSPATVYHDPAAASNPCYFTIAGAKGDVETPLYITVADNDFTSATFAVATRRRGTPGNMTWYVQAESATMGTDTTVQANDAAFSGSGSNWARTDFTNTSEATRLTMTLPAAADNAEHRGVYRVFARLRKTVSGDVIKVRMRVGSVSQSWVTLASTSLLTYDLGLLQVPAFNAGENEGYGAAHATAAGQTVDFRAIQESGTGHLDWDWVFLIPADQECAIVKTASTSDRHVLDGPNRAVYTIDNTTGALRPITGTGQPRLDGGLPMLTPGATAYTRVFILNGIGSVPALSSSAVFSAYYWPRYLLVKPATT